MVFIDVSMVFIDFVMAFKFRTFKSWSRSRGFVQGYFRCCWGIVVTLLWLVDGSCLRRGFQVKSLKGCWRCKFDIDLNFQVAEISSKIRAINLEFI